MVPIFCRRGYDGSLVRRVMPVWLNWKNLMTSAWENGLDLAEIVRRQFGRPNDGVRCATGGVQPHARAYPGTHPSADDAEAGKRFTPPSHRKTAPKDPGFQIAKSVPRIPTHACCEAGFAYQYFSNLLTHL